MIKNIYISILIAFLKKYKKEILWWIFFIIFSQTIDFDQFAYKPEDYKPNYQPDESNESNEFNNPEEVDL